MNSEAVTYSPNVNLQTMTAHYSSVNVAATLGLPQASLGPPEIGKTYIPKMNAGMRITVPFLAPHIETSMLAAAGVSHPQQLPASFDWRNIQDVLKSPSFKGLHSSQVPSPLLFGVDNQYTCGTCWAMSSATMISDRWAIKRKEPNPHLSTTPITSCATRSGVHGCDGGFPADAGHFLEKVGTTTNACYPFSAWCSGVGHCGPEPPSCSSVSVGKCLKSGQDPVRYKATRNSTRSLGQGSIDEIKQRMKLSIFLHGPLVCAFNVFGDFIQFGLHQPPGQENKNIYAHVTNSTVNGHAHEHQNPWATGHGSLGTDDKLVGRHAITVVGWGTGNHPKYGQLEYWIVRNSWGPSWNGTGYWRHAVSVPSKRINTDTGLDLPIKLGAGMLFGGATVWEADATSGPPLTQLVTNGKQPAAPSKNKSHAYLWVLAVGIVIMLVILFVITSKSKTKGLTIR